MVAKIAKRWPTAFIPFKQLVMCLKLFINRPTYKEANKTVDYDFLSTNVKKLKYN